MDDMNTTTGLDLRLLRIRHDVKSKDVARAAGKNPAWTSRIEARRVVPGYIAQEYLDALATLATIATSQTPAEVA